MLRPTRPLRRSTLRASLTDSKSGCEGESLGATERASLPSIAGTSGEACPLLHTAVNVSSTTSRRSSVPMKSRTAPLTRACPARAVPSALPIVTSRAGAGGAGDDLPAKPAPAHAEGAAGAAPAAYSAKTHGTRREAMLDEQPPPLRRTRDLFTEEELTTLRQEAQREYRHRVDLQEVLELNRTEAAAREELMETARGQEEALHAMAAEDACRLDPVNGEKGQALRRLQCRLAERARRESHALTEKEAALRDEGRRAWQEEVALGQQRAQESNALAAQRRQEENQFRAAVTFIVCRERTDREGICDDWTAAFSALAASFDAGMAEAERLAYERFFNSPEQIALREEQERQAIASKKRAAKERRRHAEEQKRFVTQCHHATNGGSLFDGPAPRKVCGRCRVRFDDEQGCYVSMDAAPPPQKRTKGLTQGKKPKNTDAASSPAEPSAVPSSTAVAIAAAAGVAASGEMSGRQAKP